MFYYNYIIKGIRGIFINGWFWVDVIKFRCILNIMWEIKKGFKENENILNRYRSYFESYS